eukprot:TRINITY_DN62973_c0_g1_i1.p1 TRINITY_DN62973_c0_g1~~TRINITY_DN62973_c0_g1_i1.p1  ORF type:complete len:800 (+),score=59.74 TRINITY_DN62973_c0_g1_i1:35-2434(+)
MQVVTGAVVDPSQRNFCRITANTVKIRDQVTQKAHEYEFDMLADNMQMLSHMALVPHLDAVTSGSACLLCMAQTAGSTKDQYIQVGQQSAELLWETHNRTVLLPVVSSPTSSQFQHATTTSSGDSPMNVWMFEVTPTTMTNLMPSICRQMPTQYQRDIGTEKSAPILSAGFSQESQLIGTRVKTLSELTALFETAQVTASPTTEDKHCVTCLQPVPHDPADPKARYGMLCIVQLAPFSSLAISSVESMQMNETLSQLSAAISKGVSINTTAVSSRLLQQLFPVLGKACASLVLGRVNSLHPTDIPHAMKVMQFINSCKRNADVLTSTPLGAHSPSSAQSPTGGGGLVGQAVNDVSLQWVETVIGQELKSLKKKAEKAVATEEQATRRLVVIEQEKRTAQRQLEKQEDETKQQRALLQDLSTKLQQQEGISKKTITELQTKLQQVTIGYEKQIQEQERRHQIEMSNLRFNYQTEINDLQTFISNLPHDMMMKSRQLRAEEKLVTEVKQQEEYERKTALHDLIQTNTFTQHEQKQMYEDVIHRHEVAMKKLAAVLKRTKQTAKVEIDGLRRQVEVLFDYSRSLTKVLKVYEQSPYFGLVKSGNIPTMGAKRLPRPPPPVNVSLVDHVVDCWKQVENYVQSIIKDDVSPFTAPLAEATRNIISFPLTFVSSEELLHSDTVTLSTKAEEITNLVKSKSPKDHSAKAVQTDSTLYSSQYAEIEEARQKMQQLETEISKCRQQYNEEVRKVGGLRVALKSQERTLSKMGEASVGKPSPSKGTSHLTKNALQRLAVIEAKKKASSL